MSLKAFHVVFILASLLLTVAFGVWCIREYRDGSGGNPLLFAAGMSFGLTVVLLVYGVWFLRKLRNVSYL
ncbi:MAG TPA: hypothetical protein VGM03_02295 [Phycisphaerae bacterium]|jgi:hypothetical protein